MRKKRSISQQLSVNNRFIAAVMFFVLSLVTALPLSAREIQKMEKKNEGTYNYFADGAKFSLTDANGLTRLYLGPFTLPEKYRVRLPNSTEDLSFAIGFISQTSPTNAVQPYKLLYNGKELQLMAQTPLIDYGARQYNPITTRWNAQDPMAEKLFDITPFSFCKNNSIVNIDFNGKFPWWAIIAGVAIDYGFQVYSNYQNDKSGFDAWIGDIDAVSLALSASPSGNVLKNLTKEAINSTKKAPKLTSKKRKC